MLPLVFNEDILSTLQTVDKNGLLYIRENVQQPVKPNYPLLVFPHTMSIATFTIMYFFSSLFRYLSPSVLNTVCFTKCLKSRISTYLGVAATL